MKFLVGIFLFFSINAKAQHLSDTLNYSGGFEKLSKHLLRYLVSNDLDVKTSTFYVAEVDFDANCQISEISIFVTGDTSYNSAIIRAIASTEKNWSSTSSHAWRLTLPIYVFKNDENGWHPQAPNLGTDHAVFNNRNSADRNIKLKVVEITITTYHRETVSPEYSAKNVGSRRDSL